MQPPMISSAYTCLPNHTNLLTNAALGNNFGMLYAMSYKTCVSYSFKIEAGIADEYGKKCQIIAFFTSSVAFLAISMIDKISVQTKLLAHFSWRSRNFIRLKIFRTTRSYIHQDRRVFNV
jgi:hypothetical protein